MKWDNLAETGDATVRHCASCDKRVYQCTSVEEFVEYGNAGKCVSIPEHLTPSNITTGLLGMVATEETLQRHANASDWWTEVLQAETEFAQEELVSIAKRIGFHKEE